MIAFLLTQPIINKVSAETEARKSEHLLLYGLRNQNIEAFNQLYRMYSPNLMGVIMKIVNQQETAEDLLQDVFLKIRKSLHTYQEDKSRLFTWMLNITRNTALDHLRKKSYRKEKSTIHIEDAAGELVSHNYSLNTDTIGIKNLICGLLPKQKLVLDLAYYQGYTHEEIAANLDMPLGSVKTTLRLAILKLRHVFCNA